MGTEIDIAVKCVIFRTISLPSFNDFGCKLTKIVLFIYLM